jgi:hypothetical protein
MSRFYITGDIHGANSIHKFSSDRFPEGKTLTKNDYVIICGDVGLIFYNKQIKEDKYLIEWLNDKPWTTLFVDGNHENHVKLLSGLISSELNPSMNSEEYWISHKFGSTIGQIADSIFHLRRGEIYDIDGLSFFCMGGAASIDKPSRRDGISWWKEEIPNFKECEYALQNLENRQYNVDYILSHTVPQLVFRNYCTLTKTPVWEDKIDSTTKFFDNIYQSTKFKKWYAGHFHIDFEIDNIHFLYDDIIKLQI